VFCFFVFAHQSPISIFFFSGSVQLRANLEQTLKPLAFHGVPLTIYCSGYGDVAAQVLALSTPGTYFEGGEGREGGKEGLNLWVFHGVAADDFL